MLGALGVHRGYLVGRLGGGVCSARHRGLRGYDREFGFYSKDNRKLLRGFQMRNDFDSHVRYTWWTDGEEMAKDGGDSISRWYPRGCETSGAL